MPKDKNASMKEYNKISKSKGLKIAIERTWQIKTTFIAATEGAQGMIKKRVR